MIEQMTSLIEITEACKHYMYPAEDSGLSCKDRILACLRVFLNRIYYFYTQSSFSLNGVKFEFITDSKLFNKFYDLTTKQKTLVDVDNVEKINNVFQRFKKTLDHQKYHSKLDEIQTIIDSFSIQPPIPEPKQPPNVESIPNTDIKPSTPKISSSSPSTLDLFNMYDKCWVEEKHDFDLSKITRDTPKDKITPGNIEELTEKLRRQFTSFAQKDLDSKNHFGFIDKHDLEEINGKQPPVYVRADLHGDLKSLLENLRTLQAQGILDDHFKCKNGAHLVFLGDYCDRSAYGTYILELLMQLSEENPGHVHFIRGNHEDTSIHFKYAGNDTRLFEMLLDQGDKSNQFREALDNFYSTLPLNTYFGLKDSQGKRQYCLLTHGMFEPAIDVSDLLDNQPSGSVVFVPKNRELSDRVKKLAEGDPNDYVTKCALRVVELVKKINHQVENSLSLCNWADAKTEGDLLESDLGLLGNRACKICPSDIDAYLTLSSVVNKVNILLRGHSHIYAHAKLDEKVVATTLTMGVEGDRTPDKDVAYLLIPDRTGWKKQLITRTKHSSDSQISGLYDINVDETTIHADNFMNMIREIFSII